MRYLLFALATLALVGCSRVASLTTLNPDGSLHEKLSLKVSNMQGLMAGLPGAAATPPGDPFAKAFKFDKTGATVTKSKLADVTVLTVERDIPAGDSPRSDFQLLSDKGTTSTDCKVEGIKLPNGDIEYDALIKYVGPPDTDLMQMDPAMRGSIKEALPARFQNTATIDGMTHDFEVGFLRTLLGPPFPEASSVMSDPDAAMLRLGGMVKSTLDGEAAKLLPDLTQAEREQFTQKLSKVFDLENLMKNQKTPGMGAIGAIGSMGSGKSAGNQDMSQMTALLYEVSFKGTVIETNGLVDPLTGHVYWCLYAASATVGDLKLHLVVRPG